MLTSAPRGTKDILPPEIDKWQQVEEAIRDVCRRYSYEEIRTPLFEHTELFLRSVGETSDIVQKEMYTFQDRAGRWLTLRPEATASTVRAYLDNKLFNRPQPVKLYYIGPMFRYDRPQAGRYRQFYQFGIEAIGSQNPGVDAEVIMLATNLFSDLGIDDLQVNLNSIGCPICRKVYREDLIRYFSDKTESLCDECKHRYEQNPLRVLDCKNNDCRKTSENAPILLNSLCDDCHNHFEKVKILLTALGIDYKLNPKLVRGLDYYTKTVFEIVSDDLGAQSTVCGGGRYDGLVEECGGKPTPAIGFAMGIERLLLILEKRNTGPVQGKKLDVFIATADDTVETEASKLLHNLRYAGFTAEKDYMQRSLKAQMKYADKKTARYVIIMGKDELENNEVVLREMQTGSQKECRLTEIIDLLRKERVSYCAKGI